jgi:hypothetical protein
MSGFPMGSRLRGNDGAFAEPARMRFFTHKKVGTTDFLLIDFYKLGTHEKFYDDLKAYLRANGWYK